MPLHWKLSEIRLSDRTIVRRIPGTLRSLLKSQPRLAALALITLFAGGPAAAQSYGIGPGSAPFSVVASDASGDTVFTINASSGLVTRNSGQGGRVSTNAANATVTISCGNTNNCNTSVPHVRVGSAGSPTGRLGGITAFNVASGTATVSNISGSNPVTFRLTPIGKNSSKTFKLGMTFAVGGDNSGDSVGSAATSYYVSAVVYPVTPPTTGPTGSVDATVYRSLSMVKNSDLNFGRIVRPLSGSDTITLNSNGTRGAVTTAAWLNSPFPVRAGYTVTGDGGKQLAISVDPTFTMNRAGGGGSLLVTTNQSFTGTPPLTAGATGTYTFFVGGSFPILSTTAGGAYSGTFNVTAAYN